MQIRWYQQSSHGTKFAISEKKRLPPVAIEETSKCRPELVPPDRRAHRLERRPQAGQRERPESEPEPGEDLRSDAERCEYDDGVLGHLDSRSDCGPSGKASGRPARRRFVRRCS